VPRAGYKQTPEHREKVRQANLGRPVSLETREKLSRMMLGKKYALGRPPSATSMPLAADNPLRPKRKYVRPNLATESLLRRGRKCA